MNLLEANCTTFAPADTDQPDASGNGADRPAPSRPQRISIVDPDIRRRATVTHFLSGHGIQAMPFDTVNELLRFHRDDVPVLIADLDDQLEDLVRGMKASGHWMPVIVYCETIAVPRVVTAIRRGAIGYLTWPFPVGELNDALDGALNLRAKPSGIDRAEIMAANRIARLSQRERQVLLGVVRGFTSRMIGERLGISHRTVEKHRENMQIKLEVRTTSDAIRLATDARLEDMDG